MFRSSIFRQIAVHRHAGSLMSYIHYTWLLDDVALSFVTLIKYSDTTLIRISSTFVTYNYFNAAMLTEYFYARYSVLVIYMSTKCFDPNTADELTDTLLLETLSREFNDLDSCLHLTNDDIETRDNDEYIPSNTYLNVSEWAPKGCTGFMVITIERRTTRQHGNVVYGDFDGFDVEFVEGEPFNNDKYWNDPSTIRDRWKREYQTIFEKVFSPLLKKYTFSFRINEP